MVFSSNSKFLSKIIIFCYLISCSSISEQNTVTHPTDENIPKKENIASSVSLRELNDFSSFLDKKIREKIVKGEFINSLDVDSIGINGGPLYDIQDIVTDNKGNIFVLSAREKKVFVFDREGSFYTTIGREGRGPGEFLAPLAIETDETGKVYVLDKTEIDVFRKERSVFKRSKPIKHPLSHTVDMCLMGSSLFISGYSIAEKDSIRKESYVNKDADRFPMTISKPIHKFDLNNGDLLQSFGKLYLSSSGWPIFTGNLSDTYLACNKVSNHVTAIFSRFPFIRGYSVEGTLKWTSTVTAFNYKPIIEDKNRSLPALKYSGTEYFDAITHFLSTDTNLVILQIESRRSLPNGDLSYVKNDLKEFQPVIHTIVIDSGTGNLVNLSNQIGHIYGWNKDFKIVQPFNGLKENIFNEGLKNINIYKIK